MDDEWARIAETITTAMEQAVEQGRLRRAKAEREKGKKRGSATDYEPGIVSFIDLLGFRARLPGG